MKRRQFLQNSVAATTAAMTGLAEQRLAAASQAAGNQEYYELRTYQVSDVKMQQVVSDYLSRALLPALGRQGISRIGVFTQLPDDEQQPDSSIYVLIPFASMELFAGHRSALAADAEYLAASEQYYAQPMKQPAYRRINSRLMVAFAGMPVMELPPQTTAKQPRIFELRIYESHNEDTARRKVEMFNQGEIQLMRDVALGPVMYGETLIGDNVPNLTYMLSAPDMERTSALEGIHRSPNMATDERNRALQRHGFEHSELVPKTNRLFPNVTVRKLDTPLLERASHRDRFRLAARFGSKDDQAERVSFCRPHRPVEPPPCHRRGQRS